MRRSAVAGLTAIATRHGIANRHDRDRDGDGVTNGCEDCPNHSRGS